MEKRATLSYGIERRIFQPGAAVKMSDKDKRARLLSIAKEMLQK